MSQLDLLPLNPATVIAACRRLEARVTAFAPELSREELTRLYGELCYISLLFDRMEQGIKAGAPYQLRMKLPELDASLEAEDRLTRARRWRSPKLPTPYRTVKRRVPDDRPAIEEPAVEPRR